MDRKVFAALAAAAGIGLSANSVAQGNQPPQPTTQTMPQPSTAMPAPQTVTMPQPATAMPQPATAMPTPVTQAAAMPPPMPASRNAPTTASSTQPAQTQQRNVPNRNSLIISNVRVPGNITYKNAKLALNGAGVYTVWFFFDKYVAALYLSNPTSIAAVAVSANEPKAIALTMLADMSKEDFIDSLNDSFKNSAPEGSGAALQSKWNKFTSFFTDLQSHDKVIIGYIPGEGTGVTINGQPRGTVSGEKFNRVIMGMWLGDNPIDGDLKNKLIGRKSQ